MSTATAPTPPTTGAPQLLRAAFVRRPHGVHGELRVEPLGGDAARFVKGLRLVAERDGAIYTVRSARPVVGGHVLLHVEEVGTRDDADGMRGAYLCVEANQRRVLADGEWFVWQLVGLRARSADGADLGRVADVEDYSENEVLVVRDFGGRISRFPMATEFVAGVDLDAGIVTLTPWPEEA